MYRKVIIFVIFQLLLPNYIFSTTCPQKGDSFPDIDISVPIKESDIRYLGIKQNTHFKISDIKSKIIIIEIFSMYCPYCQKEAPIVNELFSKIKNDSNLNNKIKIFGIGAGNTQFEVNLFKEQFNVEFPMVPDESFSVHKAIGEVRTPYFFIIDNLNGKNRIIYSKVGTIENPDKIINFILKEISK